MYPLPKSLETYIDRHRVGRRRIPAGIDGQVRALDVRLLHAEGLRCSAHHTDDGLDVEFAYVDESILVTRRARGRVAPAAAIGVRELAAVVVGIGPIQRRVVRVHDEPVAVGVAELSA